MNIAVSSVSYSGNPTWFLRILQQEGLTFNRFSATDPVSRGPEAIYANFRDLQIDDLKAESLMSPRVVFTSHFALARAMSSRLQSRTSRYFSFSAGQDLALCDLRVWTIPGITQKGFVQYGGHLDKNRNLISDSGIFVGSIDGVIVISLPWNMDNPPDQLSPLARYMTKTYSSGDRVTELTPGVDGMAVRSAVFFMLKKAHLLRGETLRRISPKPSGPQITIIRIDADGYSNRSTYLVKSLSRTLGIPFSWFIDVYAWRDQIEEVRDLSPGSEIGVHCFFHLTFQLRGSNRRNLTLARKVLKESGLDISGAVSPHGTWNQGYSKALTDCHFDYSSEFAASEPDLPFSPHRGVRPRPTQIPSTPASLGSWTGNRSYWDFADDILRYHHETLGFGVVYDHPLGRLENGIDGFESFLVNAKERGDHFMTMGEFASMWSKRDILLAEISKRQAISGTNGKLVEALPTTSNQFEVEILRLETEDLSQDTFKNIYKPPLQLIDSTWLWPRSLWMFLLGLVPLEFHLTWQVIRRKILVKPIKTKLG